MAAGLINLVGNAIAEPIFRPTRIRNDSRTTPGVGSIIREHSIEGFAQLLDVFFGRVSLIGPRPALPHEVALYDNRAMRRASGRPGPGGPRKTNECSTSASSVRWHAEKGLWK